MSEEIKEILDRIKDINNYDSTTTYEDNKITEQYDMYISKEDVDKLLDYITNLQQKLEQYEKTQTYGDYVETVNKAVELQQENENKNNKILELQQELLNKKLNVKDIEYKEKMLYKSRCEKAIDYLEKLWSFPSGNFEVAINKEENKSIDIDGNEYIDNLLNILNGSDKE